MNKMFRDRMWSHGFEVQSKWSLSGGGNDHVTRVVNTNAVNGCGKYYQFKYVEDPTAEYLMEHEEKALAFFEIS